MNHPTTPSSGQRQTPAEEQLAKLKMYMSAGVPANTQAAYRSAINDFCNEWGGRLPATPRDVCLYIVSRAEQHKPSTIALRLSCISTWHQVQGMPDPTKDASVKLTLKGVRKVHPHKPKQARPMTHAELRQIVEALDRAHKAAVEAQNYVEAMICLRDKALVLVAFWRAFRSDELSSMRAEFVSADKRKGMEIFLPSSKTDKEAKGLTFFVPAFAELCPVKAYSDWIEVAGITSGPVFSRVLPNALLSGKPLRPSSIADILRTNYKRAGIDPSGISTHSMRRGFAHWAVGQKWNARGLMDYVGWKDIKNASKYMPAVHGFGEMALSFGSDELMTPVRVGNCLPGTPGRELPREDQA